MSSNFKSYKSSKFVRYACEPPLYAMIRELTVSLQCHLNDLQTVEIRVPSDDADLHREHGDFIGTCEHAIKDPDFMNGPIDPPNCGAETVDPNCDKITNSCRPLMVISADRLRDFTEGPAETKIIGACLTPFMPLSAPLHNSNRVSTYNRKYPNVK